MPEQITLIRFLPYIAGLFILTSILGFFAEAELFIDPQNPIALPRADAIVLLGGGWEYRERRVLDLLRLGFSKQIVMTGIGEWQARGMPANCPAYDYLRAAGVAAKDILADDKARNTWQEIVWIRKVAVKYQWNSLLIVSDPPHLRRLSWVCEKVFGNTGVVYRLEPSNPDWWQLSDRWRNQSALRFAASETLKLNYYRVRYAWSKP